MTHKHNWKRSERKHGRPGRFFVKCACGSEMQATISEGHLHVFDTSVDKGGVSPTKTHRLQKWQQRILDDKGMTFSEFVTLAFRRELDDRKDDG